MRNYSLISFVLFFLLLLATGCSKDDWAGTGTKFVVLPFLGFVLVLVVQDAIKLRRALAAILDLPTSAIRKLRPGLAEVCGVIVESESSLISPWSESPCVHFEYKVEERAWFSWTECLNETERITFEIDDGTGKVTVEPDGAEFVYREVELKDEDQLEAADAKKVILIMKERFNASPSQFELEEEDQENLDETQFELEEEDQENLDETDTEIFELRHHENLLKPGTKIYVLGTVARSAQTTSFAFGETSPHGGYVIRTGKEQFIISPESEGAVTEHYKGKSKGSSGAILLILIIIGALSAWVFSWGQRLSALFANSTL
jgi:hypothetical protein